MRFCAIDFERQTIAEVLSAARFDAAEPSVWIWEGVTMYLTPAAIEATIEAVSGLSAEGSTFLITYLPRGYAAPWIRGVTEVGARIIGERVASQHEPRELAASLGRRGFEVVQDDSAIEWASRWPRDEAARVKPFERLVVARRAR